MNTQNFAKLFELSNMPYSEITDEMYVDAINALVQINPTFTVSDVAINNGRRVITYRVVLNGTTLEATNAFGGMIRRVLAGKTAEQEKKEHEDRVLAVNKAQKAAKAAARAAAKAALPVAFDSSNFSAWKADADMPEQHADGSWWDVETGLSYNPKWDYKNDKPMRGYASEFKAEKGKISEKAQDARKQSKALGGDALVGGTIKQKQWAEQIRKTKLDNAGSHLEKLLSSPAARKTTFWIDCRFLYADSIVKVAEVLDNKEELQERGWGSFVPTKAHQVIQNLGLDKQ